MGRYSYESNAKGTEVRDSSMGDLDISMSLDECKYAEGDCENDMFLFG
jgi:hypothetical protein